MLAKVDTLHTFKGQLAFGCPLCSCGANGLIPEGVNQYGALTSHHPHSSYLCLYKACTWCRDTCMHITYILVHLLKDTNGHLFNKARVTWQQVLWKPLILPLTNGQLSNEDRVIWGRGVPIRGGLLSLYSVYTHDTLVRHLYISFK